jgi:hypothetical protein
LSKTAAATRAEADSLRFLTTGLSATKTPNARQHQFPPPPPPPRPPAARRNPMGRRAAQRHHRKCAGGTEQTCGSQTPTSSTPNSCGLVTRLPHSHRSFVRPSADGDEGRTQLNCRTVVEWGKKRRVLGGAMMCRFNFQHAHCLEPFEASCKFFFWKCVR